MENLSPHEALLQKHKLEKKNLQAKIQSLKNTVTKGDKKKKKEIHDEITKLEEDLAKTHELELKALDETPKINQVEVLTDKIEDVNLDQDLQPKMTKAQKRRQKKHQSNVERNERIAAEEEENKNGLRNTETKKIGEKLREKKLMTFEIPSDGDCLYNAVNHALKNPIGVNLLRQKVSQYILNNPNEYLPYLTDQATGEPMDEEKFQQYCGRIADTKQWGGQVELDALANILGKTLVVVQGDGPELHMGEQFCENGVITLSYHRHMYSLGEHYNSVQPYVQPDDF